MINKSYIFTFCYHESCHRWSKTRFTPCGVYQIVIQSGLEEKQKDHKEHQTTSNNVKQHQNNINIPYNEQDQETWRKIEIRNHLGPYQHQNKVPFSAAFVLKHPTLTFVECPGRWDGQLPPQWQCGWSPAAPRHKVEQRHGTLRCSSHTQI